jgi:cell division protein ZapA
MSQSIVTIRLNGTPYQIGCGEGEEAHIESLASEIDAILQSLVASVGQIGEARLLAMAALILADRAHDGGADMATTPSPGDQDSQTAAAALETAADRILALASRLSSH